MSDLTNKPEDEPRVWWEEFSTEERVELEAWLAEVNTVNEELPPYDCEAGEAGGDSTAGQGDCPVI